MPRVPSVDSPQQGKGVRRHEGARNALKSAREDQDASVRRRSGKRGGGCETDDAGHQHLAPPDAVADRSPDEVEGCEGQGVAQHHPLLAGEPEVEVASDGRQADEHDAGVDERKRRADDRRPEREPASVCFRVCGPSKSFDLLGHRPPGRSHECRCMGKRRAPQRHSLRVDARRSGERREPPAALARSASSARLPRHRQAARAERRRCSSSRLSS